MDGAKWRGGFAGGCAGMPSAFCDARSGGMLTNSEAAGDDVAQDGLPLRGEVRRKLRGCRRLLDNKRRFPPGVNRTGFWLALLGYREGCGWISLRGNSLRRYFALPGYFT